MGLPVIVAPANRGWCGGVVGRTHVRAPGGLCEACNDYRPDWSWESPTLATAFDDGRRNGMAHGVADERARIVRWMRQYIDSPQRASLADRIEKGEHESF